VEDLAKFIKENGKHEVDAYVAPPAEEAGTSDADSKQTPTPTPTATEESTKESVTSEATEATKTAVKDSGDDDREHHEL
jgi:hypothetical protein